SSREETRRPLSKLDGPVTCVHTLILLCCLYLASQAIEYLGFLDGTTTSQNCYESKNSNSQQNKHPSSTSTGKRQDKCTGSSLVDYLGIAHPRLRSASVFRDGEFDWSSKQLVSVQCASLY